MANLNKITCIDDLRKVMRLKVPKMFYDYVDSGSYTESTYHANTEDFKRLKFRQRVGLDICNRSIQTTVLGQKVAMPVILAPTGITGMQRADGEILAAKAAERFGVPFTLSTMSVCSIEDIAAHTSAPFWFQLYVMKDKDFMRALIDRAKAANCSALMLTLDLQVMGQRHKDIKNGLSAPPKPTLMNLLNLALKPEWCWQMLHTKRRFMGNIVGHAKGVSDMSSLAVWTSEQFDPELNWAQVEEIKNYWCGPIILKGILDKEDALIAAKINADAIVVSNHGGRQLDGAPSSISVLPEIVEAVRKSGSNMEILLDGGIQQGQDVLRSLALGAQATMIGRAFLYGLGAYGQEGVSKALSIIANELDVSMGFCGKRSIQEIDHSILLDPLNQSRH